MPENTDVPKFDTIEALRSYIAECESEIALVAARRDADIGDAKRAFHYAAKPIRARIAAAKRLVYGLTFKKKTTA